MLSPTTLNGHHPLLKRQMRRSRKRRAAARILCPLDFTPESKFALRYAAALASDLGAGLVLLHIVEPAVSQADFGYGCVTTRCPNQEALKAAQRKLNSLRGRLLPCSRVPLAIVRTGTPDAEIVRAASDLGADLILLGIHGRDSTCTRTGSTVEHIVHAARCPVLVLPVRQSVTPRLLTMRRPGDTPPRGETKNAKT